MIFIFYIGQAVSLRLDASRYAKSASVYYQQQLWSAGLPSSREMADFNPCFAVNRQFEDGRVGISDLARLRDVIANVFSFGDLLPGFHLLRYGQMKNLGEVGGALKRLNQAEILFWQRKVEETLALFEPLSKPSAQNFCNYIRKHQARIVNYSYYQAEGISIGSCAVESTVK